MLFAYPIEASAENWLHDCLAEMLRNDMDALDADLAVALWPDCIGAAHRDAIKRHTKLKDHREALLKCYDDLPQQGRFQVRRAMTDQAALLELFEGGRDADRLEDLPEDCRAPLKAFFEKAFAMLTPLGIRDENYRAFLNLIEHKVCAFCGSEYFSGASSKREPLDHYLAVSVYPFAGANARNLVPMGPKCNSSYKLDQDILRDAAAGRRVCFDPFAAAPVGVSVMQSTLFGRADGLPNWSVDFHGDPARIATWNEVFDIRRRFIEDHLDSIYKNAIKVFAVLRMKQPAILAQGGLVGAFNHLADLSRAKGFSDRAFLETAVYELLADRSVGQDPEGDRLRATFRV